MSTTIKIDNKLISNKHPVYFVADIAANHDGDLERAKELIYLCAEAGADAAKFQHFQANTIVSDYGFKSLGVQQSHQSKWNKSVFEVYKDASLESDWTPILKETCDKAGISFFTSPYSLDIVDEVDQYVAAYKVGSGDITWLEIIEKMGNYRKPLILATGASSLNEVKMAMDTALTKTKDVVLMQCNTNYTSSSDNFKHINLNVLKSYKNIYPEVILGLSDHTPGFVTVLGAVALGAKVIEKHFTDSVSRNGPDHKFSMDLKNWQEMMHRTKELEESLGISIKKVEDNEKETVVLQRRAIRAKQNLILGDVINKENTEVLRPCPSDSLPPYEMPNIVGKILLNNVVAGECIKWEDLKSS
jgi:N-acetylneuraminate synthase